MDIFTEQSQQRRNEVWSADRNNAAIPELGYILVGLVFWLNSANEEREQFG